MPHAESDRQIKPDQWTPFAEEMKLWDAAHAASSARLRELRKRAGLTLWQLASASNVSLSNIKRIEEGCFRVTIRNALKLSPHLNCTPAYLLFGI